MKRHLSFLFVVLALFSAIGCSSTGGKDSMLSSLAADPGITALAEKTGVTANQAVGGVGSVLALAKNKLPADQFSQLTAGMPSADKYMQSLSGMGVNAGDIKDVIYLREALQKLGMTEEVATRFMPEAVNLVRSSGGAAATDILSNLGL